MYIWFGKESFHSIKNYTSFIAFPISSNNNKFIKQIHEILKNSKKFVNNKKEHIHKKKMDEWLFN